jgi:predicted secreted protein
MSVILGRNVKIYKGASGTDPIVAGAKSCTVHVTDELIQKSSSSQSSWKEWLAGWKEWDVALNHLIPAGSGQNTTATLLMPSQTYTIRFTVPDGQTLSGQVICTDATITGSVGALATGDIKFKGNGELAPT